MHGPRPQDPLPGCHLDAPCSQALLLNQILTRRASFDVALLCFLRPEGATTNQPRATPWGRSSRRTEVPPTRAASPCKGKTIPELCRPFRAWIVHAFSLPQSVALGWYVRPFLGND